MVPIPTDFLELSARLGADPLQIQGPGGNTSIKNDKMMWIKASGTELADAMTTEIFVAVDLARARAEIADTGQGVGDGTCRAAMLDISSSIRPSIETTFHALIDHPVVAHTHSVAALAHLTSDAGTKAALDKLMGLEPVVVPYCKPGLPLTLSIRDAMTPTTHVFLLRNHGIIVAGGTSAEVDERIRDVEARLEMPASRSSNELRSATGSRQVRIDPPAGWRRARADIHLKTQAERACAGSYWPDHVVFLGPSVARDPRCARLEQMVALAGDDVLLRERAKPIQTIMLGCLADVLARVPSDWIMAPIGAAAEAELLEWDAEAYRQTLAGRD